MPVISKHTTAKAPTNGPAPLPSQEGRAPSAWGTQSDPILKVLLYGRSGTGKTTLWATFPKPILAIVCAGANQTGELRSIDTPEHRKVIDPRIVTSREEFERELAHAGKYATVVLDHVVGLQDTILTEILGLDQVPVAKRWGTASQKQFGQCTFVMKELLSKLLNQPTNVVIVGHERTFSGNEESDVVKPAVAVSLMPILGGWLNSTCDYVMQTYLRHKVEIVQVPIGEGEGAQVVEMEKPSREVEYCLRTAPDAVYAAKFRLPRGRILPECIVDPSYEKILAVIQGRL